MLAIVQRINMILEALKKRFRVDNDDAVATARAPAWLSRYGLVSIFYIVVTMATNAWYLADTPDYVREIHQRSEGLNGGIWDFGHLLWRPLGYVVFLLCGPLVKQVVG